MNIEKIRPFFIPFLLFIISFLLRLSLISKGPFHIDCLNLALRAQETLDTGRIQPLLGFGYPLTVLLGALFIKITSLVGNTDPVFAVNLMSVTFGALGVSALFLFVYEVIDKRSALFSSILFCFYPFFFGVSLYGMSHTPALFFLLTGLWLLRLFKRHDRRLHLVLSSVCFGCMAACRLQDMVLLFIPISLYFFMDNNLGLDKHNIFTTIKSKLSGFTLLIIIIVSLTILFHLPLLIDVNYQQKSAILWFWQAGLTSNFLGFFSEHLLVSLRMLMFSLSPLGVLLALSGISLLFKKRSSLFLLLILWLLFPLLFYGNLYTTTSRFLIIAAIPLIIAEGYILAYLANSHRMVVKSASILCFGLIIWVTFKEVYPIFKFRHDNAPLVDFSRWVATVTEPDAVIISTDDNHFLKYYAQRDTAHNPCDIYRVKKEALPAFKKWLDKKFADNRSAYITLNGLRAGDTTHEFRDFMFDNYDLSWVGQHLSEDWHGSSTRLIIGQEHLYKIIPKNNR